MQKTARKGKIMFFLEFQKKPILQEIYTQNYD